ncbi:hypothetical protein GCM10018980_11470 [Streptomyces capoamus]|uniref:Uncharacterized protein n=1 Tax=Streptomyces capoamus TaxID=68183 RepID=A0A919C131_9ACTN|nr:hypothetical protein GCM10010501_34430 [Streptomyces libani subsp. rufus]GHG38579.1 hypothetical protein GCM10018980_11470 [Streptomyces capoamus]
MEICIAVADWARGLTTWVLDVPGGEGTGATRRKRPRHVRLTHVQHRVYRVSPSGTTGRSTAGSTTGPTASGRGAGMVVGWG